MTRSLSPAAADDLILRNAQIIDPITQTVTRGSLVIRDGYIAEFADGGNIPSPESVRIVDLGGRWVIPGLNDMHVHSYGNLGPDGSLHLSDVDGSARLMLYSGVTGFLDLFYGSEERIFGMRDRQRQNGMLGADIYAAGPIFTYPGGHGTEFKVPTRTVRNPEEAVREVLSLATKKPDVVKLVYDHAIAFRFPTIDKATMEALIKTAASRGIKTVVHVGTWNDAREAILAGATAITHLHEKPVPDDVVELMVQHHVYSIPTLAVQLDFPRSIHDSTIFDPPLAQDVASERLIALYGNPARCLIGFQRMAERFANGAEEYYRTIKQLSDRGVKIMTGTDAGNPGTLQGYSLHRELIHLVKAGLSPWQALNAATTVPGEFLGKPFGVRPGSVANLVVLKESPIANIENTQRIEAVMSHGEFIMPRELLLR